MEILINSNTFNWPAGFTSAISIPIWSFLAHSNTHIGITEILSCWTSGTSFSTSRACLTVSFTPATTLTIWCNKVSSITRGTTNAYVRCHWTWTTHTCIIKENVAIMKSIFTDLCIKFNTTGKSQVLSRKNGPDWRVKKSPFWGDRWICY